MPLITLKPLDDGQKPVEIPFGKTTIGRGTLLGCSDKKVSRNHAVLEVTTSGEVYLTPTHVNPCFYQPTVYNPGQILKKDVPHKLQNGDTFSLLPRAYRYQLNIAGDAKDDKSQSDNIKSCGKPNGSTIEEPANVPKEATKESSNEELKTSVKGTTDRISVKENNIPKNPDNAEEKTALISKDSKVANKETEATKKEQSNSPKEKNVDAAIAESVDKEEEIASPAELKDNTDLSRSEHSKVNDSSVENCIDSDEHSKSTSDKTAESEANPKSVSKNSAPETDDISRDNKPDQKISDESVDSKRTDHSEESGEANTNTLPPKDAASEEEVENEKPSRTETVSPAKRGRKKQAAPKQPREKKPPKRKTDEAPKPRGRKKMKNIDFESGEEGPSQRQTPGRTSSRTNRQTRQGLSLEDFIVSDDEEWQSDRLEPKKRRRKRGTRKGDDSGSDWEVEHKKTKKPIHKLGSGSESGSDLGLQKKQKGGPRGRRKEKLSTSEPGSEEEPEQSTSNATKNDQPRTPCTFGKKCYRRNVKHTDQFSHPGDSDYNSETESSQKNDATSDAETETRKKECPYGENCFRKNPQHKKDFKHTKKVRPQREAAKQADKKAKGSRNSDEIDSYDLNDSFLNDDSADEYKPVDSGSDYESGEKMKRLAKTKAGKNKRGRKV